jgi:hypothetical protein
MEQYVGELNTCNDVYDDVQSFENVTYRDMCVLWFPNAVEVPHFLRVFVDAIITVLGYQPDELYFHHPSELGVTTHHL